MTVGSAAGGACCPAAVVAASVVFAALFASDDVVLAEVLVFAEEFDVVFAFAVELEAPLELLAELASDEFALDELALEFVDFGRSDQSCPCGCCCCSGGLGGGEACSVASSSAAKGCESVFESDVKDGCRCVLASENDALMSDVILGDARPGVLGTAEPPKAISSGKPPATRGPVPRA